jgi:two-component system, NtrC family, response regulator AtoC
MKILLIDDEPMITRSIENFLKNQLGHDIVVFNNAEEALKNFRQNQYEMVLTDIRMPGLSGVDLLQKIKDSNSDADVVLMTGHASIDNVIDALRSGAYDYLRKPVNIALLASVVIRVEEHQKLIRSNRVLTTKFENKVKEECILIEDRLRDLQHAFSEATGIGRIGFFSQQSQDIVRLAKRLHKDRSISVLIQGETGTGKEVIARIIHYGDEAAAQPFISLNCSALSESLFESELFGYEPGAFTGASPRGKIGKLELAAEGTIFLDEIGDMPCNLQPKLLKALQDREIYRLSGTRKIKLDIRTIFATNRDLLDDITQNRFREDLYYRINTVIIVIPPLRKRKEEIIPLAQFFLQEFARQHELKTKKLTREAGNFLQEYHWPGNIRQLKNTIDRVCFISETNEIRPQDLSFLDRNLADKKIADERQLTINFPDEQADLYQIDRNICRYALRLHKNNKTRTARYLGISLNRLKRILGEM